MNELLTEADRRSDTEPAATARDLRTLVLPRAEANRVRAARIIVQHPRARALHAQLVRLMEQRARTVEAYASALEPHDDRALLTSLQQQRRLQEDLAGLETSVLQARAAPPEYGCSVRRPGL